MTHAFDVLRSITANKSIYRAFQALEQVIESLPKHRIKLENDIEAIWFYNYFRNATDSISLSEPTPLETD